MSQISSKYVQRFEPEKSKMCLTKSVKKNCKYRSQWPNLNKLETRPPGDSPNQIWMISDQWFYRRRFAQKLHKITHNSMTNKGSTPIFTNLVRVHPRNIHKKFEANPCSGLREVEKLNKFTPTTTTTTDTWWSLESHSLVEAVCPNSMVDFGMTRSGREPKTYEKRAHKPSTRFVLRDF